MKTSLTLILLAVFHISAKCQTYVSRVSVEGNPTAVLLSKSSAVPSQGKLSTGEVISSGSDHGSCYFRINYNGRRIEESLGENFSLLKIYEFDFGGDGDKELVVSVDERKVNKQGDYDKPTTTLYVYRYSKGMLQMIFEKEVKLYKTVVSKNYIEYYMPSGLDSIWNYYKGAFYSMTQVDIKQ